MTSVGVIGAGAWGTTVANLVAQKNQSVTVWCYKQAIADQINHHQSHHRLPGVRLHSGISATTTLEDCYGCDVIVLGLSSQQLMAYDHQLDWSAMRQVVTLAKGMIDPDMFISDWLSKRCGGDVAVLSGPNLALEIAQEKPATSVVASRNEALASRLQQQFSHSYFRVYTTGDVRGVECGGIFKNIFAIAAGCLDALSYGQNAKAALITRGLIELERLFDYFNADRFTLMGLSGLGDLIATCTSNQSRNWQLGFERIEQPDRTEWDVTARGQTEGLRTIQLLKAHGIIDTVELPIIQSLWRLFFDPAATPHILVQSLMERGLKSESVR